jgi:penicillin-binding protein A
VKIRSRSSFYAITAFLSVTVAVLVIFAAQKPDLEAIAQQKLLTNLEHRTRIAEALAEPLSRLEFPQRLNISLEDKSVSLAPSYTLDERLQKEAANLLRRYKPDYGAIFMIDARTGRVLVYTSFQRDSATPVNLVSRATFPAASVFKVVTSAAAIDGQGLEPGHRIRFNGGNYTLYKKNVLSDKINRWTRTITLRDAFAKSYNTAFGRLSLENLTPEIINEYANRFMFNQKIASDFNVDQGTALIPQTMGFEMTEVASGFNKNNRMSPVQGALIAATVVNDGKMVMPYLIDSLTDVQNGQTVYKAETVDNGQVVSTESSQDLKELMSATVTTGTSRKVFRPLVKDKKFREIEFGGKTGHLTGDNPKGRVDWFVGYATDDEQRIAIATLTVNKKFWTVKSSHLANVLFRKSFQIQQPEKLRNISSANSRSKRSKVNR